MPITSPATGVSAAATGATIHVHRLAEPDYEHEPFDGGWELELGDLVVRALHTPGHRPEHTAFALVDRSRGEEPWAVLSGDTLFVGDVARPDLAIDKSEGARGIFHSLHDQILTLPDTCEVWPGHLGGSMCGGPGMDMKVSSTIGYERGAQPGPRRGRRGSLRRAVDRQAGTAAAELPGDRRSQPGTVADDRRGGRPADAAPGRDQARGGRAARRRPHRRAVRRRARPRGGVHHQAQRRLRHEARLDRRPRTGDRADRPRRRGRSQRCQTLHGRGDPQDRRVPARRHDELARGAPRGRADRARCRPGSAGPRRGGSGAPDPRRARAWRVGRRAPARLGAHALPRCRRAFPRGWIPTARSPSSAAPVSVPRSARASSPASGPPRSCTSPPAVCRP